MSDDINPLIDKPEGSDQGKEAQKEETRTPPIVEHPIGTLPATQPEEKTQAPSHAKQYAAKIAWPFVELYKLLRKGFLLADRHNGGITAIATAAIGVLTYMYVSSSADQVKLQKAIAKVAYGAPFLGVRPDWTGLFDLGEGKKLRIVLHLQNNGKRDAGDVYGAMNVDFRERPPVPKFTTKDFKRAEPFALSPLIGAVVGPYAILRKEFDEPISAKQYASYKAKTTKLYIWGQFTYSDFTGQQTKDDFCIFVSAEDVLTAGDDANGYSGPYNQCPKKDTYLH